MPFYRFQGTLVHLRLSGKLRKSPPAPCCAPITVKGDRENCMGISEFLCDEPVGDEGKTAGLPRPRATPRSTGARALDAQR